MKLSVEQIQKVCAISPTWQTQEGESAQPELYSAAKKEEIASKGYSLVPSRYIEFVDRDTEIDYKTALTQMSQEFEKLKERWNKNEEELSNAFKTLGYGGE